MKQVQIAALVASLIVVFDLVLGSYYAVQISLGFDFTDSLLYELVLVIIKALVLFYPASILIREDNYKLIKPWLAWLYTIIIFLGLLNLYLFKDSLESGLPMLLIVFPFCLIFSLFLLFKKYKKT